VTRASPQYDIFLSHNSADKASVEEIGTRLREDGFHPFLDKWHLVPGKPWQTELAEALDDSASAAVFFGAGGSGAWQTEEMQVALNKAVRTRDDYRVIPVLLPGSDPSQVDGFLELRTWVDFRAGLDDRAAYDRLVAAIKGVAPDESGYELPDEPRPYRGLDRFDSDQHEFFFGRDDEIRRLIERLAQDRFVAVVGASGSGKSSLVRAGLSTEVAETASPGIRGWRRITFTPGSDPLRQTATHLVAHLPEAERPALVRGFLDDLRRGPEGLITALTTLFPSPDEPVVLVVDQFEEVFTHRPANGEARDEWRARTAAFAANLRTTCEARLDWLRVIATIRADFVDRFVGGDFPDFRELLERHQFWLGEMGRDDLREAIVLPARRRGAFFEKGLVEVILRDMRGQTAALPLLEEALEALWVARRGPWLTIDDYQESGGVEGALAAKAERVYGSLNGEQKKIARRVLLGLIQLGEGSRDVRRRAVLGRLGESARGVVEVLTGPQARLLVTDRDAATGEETVEVTHEALVEGWDRLERWLDADREFLLWRQRLRAALEAWGRTQQDDGTLLRGAPLVEAEEWLERRREELSTEEREFIEGGVRRRRHARRLKAFLGAGAAAVLLLFTAVVGILYLRAERRAEQIRVSSIVTNASAARDPLLAALLLAELRGVADHEAPPGGVAIAREVAETPFPILVLEGHETWVRTASFSPDGRRIVTTSDDRTARVWNADGTGRPVVIEDKTSAAFSPDGSRLLTVRSGGDTSVWNADGTGEPVVLDGFGLRSRNAAFSPDGKRIVSASSDGAAWVWAADGSGEPQKLEGHRQGILDAAFSSDGRRIVTGSLDDTARVWAADGGGEPVVLEGHDDYVVKVAFSHDGSRILTTSSDDTARVWNSDGSGEPVVLEGHGGKLSSAAFSPDGHRVVTASEDGTARMWSAGGSEEPVVLEGHGDGVYGAVFSPDGSRVLTFSWDRTARVWSADGTGEPVILAGHEDAVYGAAFSADGRRIVTASRDTTAWVWNAGGSDEPQVLSFERAPEGTMGFSPDAERVFAAFADGTVRVRNVDGSGETVVLEGHEDVVLVAAFSPDGSRLVTGSADGTARVWEAAAGESLVLEEGEGWVFSVAFSPDGERVMTIPFSGTARVWNADGSGEPLVLGGQGARVSSAVFSPADGRIVATFEDGPARSWNADGSGEVLLEGLEGAVRAVSPDGRRIVTTSNGGTARVWNADGSGEPKVLEGHEHDVQRVVFSPGGRRILTASDDGTARIWNADGSGQVVVLDGHQGTVYSASFSSDGGRIVTASEDGTARVWRADGSGEAIVLEGHQGDLIATFSPDGRRVLTAAADGTARVWNVDWSDLLDYLRDATDECLSPAQRTRYLGEDAARARVRHEACEVEEGREPPTG